MVKPGPKSLRLGLRNYLRQTTAEKDVYWGMIEI